MHTHSQKATKLATLILLALGLACVTFFQGCPDSKPPAENANPDGGNTDKGGTDSVTKPLTCEKGTLCVVVGSEGVRGCDVMLKNKAAIDKPEVSFADDVIGQSMHKDSRIGFFFIAKEDKDLDTKGSSVLLKLPDGIDGVELSSATCYDSKGAKIDKADVKLQKP